MFFQKTVYFIFWIINFFVSVVMIIAAVDTPFASQFIQDYTPHYALPLLGDYGHLILLIVGIFYFILTVKRISYKRANSFAGKKALIATCSDGSKIEVLFQTFNDAMKAYTQELDYVKRASVITLEGKEGIEAKIKLQVFVEEGLNKEVQDLKDELVDYIQKTFGIVIKKIDIILV
ncbi:MAG: hypothetical protein NTX05_04670 [Fusobacteria bacterium]|nr:hypothetical protein [Fusobacteriota bacterium]